MKSNYHDESNYLTVIMLTVIGFVTVIGFRGFRLPSYAIRRPEKNQIMNTCRGMRENSHSPVTVSTMLHTVRPARPTSSQLVLVPRLPGVMQLYNDCTEKIALDVNSDNIRFLLKPIYFFLLSRY